MLLKLKEASWVVFDISVAEVVKLVIEGFADVLLEFRTVLGEMLVKLASGIFEIVCCNSGLTLANKLIDSAFHIRSSQVFDFEQE